jgi:hypothetical protein
MRLALLINGIETLTSDVSQEILITAHQMGLITPVLPPNTVVDFVLTDSEGGARIHSEGFIQGETLRRN